MGSAHSPTMAREDCALSLFPAVRPFLRVDGRRCQIARPTPRRQSRHAGLSGTPRDGSMRNPGGGFPRISLTREQTKRARADGQKLALFALLPLFGGPMPFGIAFALGTLLELPHPAAQTPRELRDGLAPEKEQDHHEHYDQVCGRLQSRKHERLTS